MTGALVVAGATACAVLPPRLDKGDLRTCSPGNLNLTGAFVGCSRILATEGTRQRTAALR